MISKYKSLIRDIWVGLRRRKPHRVRVLLSCNTQYLSPQPNIFPIFVRKRWLVTPSQWRLLILYTLRISVRKPDGWPEGNKKLPLLVQYLIHHPQGKSHSYHHCKPTALFLTSRLIPSMHHLVPHPCYMLCCQSSYRVTWLSCLLTWCAVTVLRCHQKQACIMWQRDGVGDAAAGKMKMNITMLFHRCNHPFPNVKSSIKDGALWSYCTDGSAGKKIP